MSVTKIIALAGLSGAGKTTTLTKLMSSASFEYLSASELIKEQRLLEVDESVSSEQLRMSDIRDNQELFVIAFLRRVAQTKSSVILDCHTVIDTPAGFEMVPEETFDELGLTHFAYLFIEPDLLVQRRRDDKSRERPLRYEKELIQHQRAALTQAKRISDRLKIPFIEISKSDPIELLAALLSAT